MLPPLALGTQEADRRATIAQRTCVYAVSFMSRGGNSSVTDEAYTSRAGRILAAAGSDEERRQGGRQIPNHAPTVASSVLHQDIAGRQQHLRAIVELECHIAGEKDPEIRRVGPVKAGFVAILDVHLGRGFWCNHAIWRVRSYDETDTT